MSTEVRVPTLGESVTEATVATWFKKPGDTVAVDEMLCELETDKVTVEVPSPAAGTLGEIVAAEGETVGVDARCWPRWRPAKGPARRGQGGGERRPRRGRDLRHRRDDSGDAGAAKVDVMVPTLGESVSEATVSTWFKQVGDTRRAGRDAVRAGNRQGLGRGARPGLGHVVGILAAEGTTVEPRPDRRERRRRGLGRCPRRKASKRPPAARRAGFRPRKTPPRRRKMMAEKGLSPDDVKGGGRDGRIMKEDVQKAAPPRPRPHRPPRRPPPPRRARPPARGCLARGTGEDDPPAPDHRQAPEGRAEHRRDPDHL